MRSLSSLVPICLLLSAVAGAQTISTNPLAAAYTVGDEVAVSFNTTGTFAAGNAFIAQLSDANGNFTTGFRNLGSITGTGSGIINVTIPNDVAGTGYRIRVMASNPVTMGSDNGADLTFYPIPTAKFGVSSEHAEWLPVTVGDLITIGNASTADPLTYAWNFGSGATPAASSARNPGTVTYATPGTKTITLTITNPVGRTSTATATLEVSTLSNLAIAADAIPIQGEQDIRRTDSTGVPVRYWVCPGGNLKLHSTRFRRFIIHVEGGGSVTLGGIQDHTVVYMKNGATVNTNAGHDVLVVHEPNVGLMGEHQHSEVTTLTYDYTSAPVGGCPSLAPYTRRLPVDVRNITEKKNNDENSATFWVRSGGELAASGTGNTYAVEEGGRVTATGNNSVVYLKNGATFDAAGTSGNRIFHELGAVIVNAGDGAALFPSSGIMFVYEGPSSVLFEPGVSASKLLMAPNPAHGSVRIGSVDGSVLESVSLWNTLGERVLEREVKGVAEVDLSLAGITAGVYYVHAGTQRGVLIEKLVVR